MAGGMLLLAIIVFVRTTDVRALLAPENVEAFLVRMGPWAPISYLFLYAAVTVLALPGTAMTLVGGVLFGRWLGTLLAVLSATVGACCTFAISRTLGREYVARRFADQPWFEKLEQGLAENGLAFMLFVRLVPLFPPLGINYASGLTAVRWRDYALGTALGILPGTFAYANLAAEAGSLAIDGAQPSPGLIISFAIAGFFVLVPTIYRAWKLRKGS
jgi:uncharacterized membrane protein YdjX (TVP38/TMEM64 family)